MHCSHFKGSYNNNAAFNTMCTVTNLCIIVPFWAFFNRIEVHEGENFSNDVTPLHNGRFLKPIKVLQDP